MDTSSPAPTSLLRKGGVSYPKKKESSETIHSGHFMLSEIDESGPDMEAASPLEETRGYDDIDQPVLVSGEAEKVLREAKEDNLEFKYGPTDNQKTVTVDKSLNKLFKTMTIAYGEELTSPKWKSFKGLRLKVKDKIRLNNIIWREWHMQYIQGRRPPVCRFQTTLDVHNKPEAVLLEGKYWKRGTSSVTAEYNKWRQFSTLKHLSTLTSSQSEYGSEKSFGQGDRLSSSWQDLGFDDDLMNFNDTSLFSLFQPNANFAFPSTREIARSGVMVDCIQPSLSQLQPPIIDLAMDFEDIFSTMTNQKPMSILPTLQEETPADVEQQQQQQSPMTKSTMSMTQTTMGQLQSSAGQMMPLTDLTSVGTSQATSSYEVQSYPSQPTSMQMEYQMDKKDSNNIMNNMTFQSTYVSQSMSMDSNNQVQYGVAKAMNAPTTSYMETMDIDQQAMTMPYGYPLSRMPTLPTSNSTSAIFPTMVPRKMSPTARVPLERSSSLPLHGKGSPLSTLSNPLSPSSNKPSMNGSIIAQLLNSNNNSRPLQLPFQPSTSRSPSYVASPSSSSTPSFGHIGTTLSPLSSSATSPMTEPASYGPSSFAVPAPRFADDLAYGMSKKDSPVRKISSPARICSNHPSALPITSHNSFGSHPSFHIDESGNNTTPPAFTLGRTTATRAKHLHHQQPASPSPLSPVANSAVTLSPPSSSPTTLQDHQEKMQYREHRRVCHINAEQKRRCNIKNGFDTLRQILPSVSQSASSKVSKAAMLSKGAEHIRQLKQEMRQKQDELRELEQKIDSYNQAISNFTSQLPATGAPVACQRTGHVKEMFQDYVREKTLENWKFYIFSSIVMEPMLESFDANTSTSNMNDLCKTTMNWLDSNCSLVSLRKDVLQSLRNLSTTTSILTNPAALPEESLRAATAKREE